MGLTPKPKLAALCRNYSRLNTLFGHDGRLFLPSGIGPNGAGDDEVIAFAAGGLARPLRLVAGSELSPLDLAIAPNGNIIVSSEHPFGSPDAVTH